MNQTLQYAIADFVNPQYDGKQLLRSNESKAMFPDIVDKDF